MIIVYAPAGGEREEYDARTLRVSEAAIVSRTTDMTWGAVRDGIARDDLEAMRAVVWVLKKRSHPSLRYAEFDPGVEEMYARFDRDEITSWVESAVAAVEAAPTATPEDLASALSGMPAAALDREHAETLIRRAVEEYAEGKEAPAGQQDSPDASPSTTSSGPEPSTSDVSPTSSTSPLETSTA
ncbi:hypothetical protein ABZ508_02555 [Streptomyces lavendulocolor]|uniref:Uncharacterized protein n=1 Tax=Streptomyces lavendulocolor TaxID=67316 RepID=A0ABV2W0K1_9ACTN